MFNPPIGEGANIFIWIVVFLIAFVAGLIHVDLFNIFGKKPKDKEKEAH